MLTRIEKLRSKVFLVDDHPLVREHLAALLQAETDIEVCGEAGDGPTAISLIGQRQPDLVILDISLKRSHGLELLKDLKALRPDLPVLVLSMHDEALYAERALRAGASGYITKEAATVNVLSAVRKVLAGQVYLSEAMAGRMVQKLVGGCTPAFTSLPELLADRELEVYRLVGRGLGTRQIAEEMRLGIKTVESYKARIKEKLGLADGNQLLQHAIEWLRTENRV
jgi:DNA-binding NarL/FixJ family response regulator